MIYEDIFKWITPFIIGGASAFLASWLALRKFKSEKTWDERRAAYKEVIESFEELAHWSEQVRASHCCEPTIGGKGKFDESLRTISKYSATGSLLFSTEFQEILDVANAEINRVRFQVDDESKPDMGSDREMSEWYFILAKEIRGIVDNSLPKLINTARSERP